MSEQAKLHLCLQLLLISRASLGAQLVKNPPAVQETWDRSLGWEDALEEETVTHSSILAWEIHGQRSFKGYNQWDRKELDTTE